MLLVEMMIGSTRTDYCQEQTNKMNLRENLVLLEEQRECSSIRQAAYKKIAERHYNQRVKDKAFRVGDYVLRKNEAKHTQPHGKLSQTWEGLYKVVEVHRNGSYSLEKPEGRQILRIWNARNLRKFHF